MECANSIPKPMATMERNNSIYWKHSMTFLSKSFGSIGFHWFRLVSIWWQMPHAQCFVHFILYVYRINIFFPLHMWHIWLYLKTPTFQWTALLGFFLWARVQYMRMYSCMWFIFDVKKNNMMFCLGRHRFDHAKQWTFLISVNCDNFMSFVKSFHMSFFAFGRTFCPFECLSRIQSANETNRPVRRYFVMI